jgi:hypothetical protein
VGNPIASETSPATGASSVMCEVLSLTRSNESVSVRTTSCDDPRGLVRYSTMTTRPEMTIAASQATTAVQMIANASEPTTGTSSASMFPPLRITISSTTPTASTSRKRGQPAGRAARGARQEVAC